MKNLIIAHNGSVQNIPNIPADVKAIYKTVWEISQKKVLDLAADRGAFICQSQSLNVHLQSPTVGQLTSMHFYGWKKGLKTGMYYLRTRPAAQAQQFTVDQSLLKQAKEQQKSAASAKKAAAAAARPVGGATIPTPAATPVIPASATPVSAPIEAAPVASSSSSSATPAPASAASAEALTSGLDALSLDEKTRAAAEADPEFAAALERKALRELEEAKMLCSIENKEACLMCSG